MPKAIPLVLCIVSLICFATLAQGYTHFDTKCSTPDTSTNFVSSPDSRGTLDILWSCAFMIIACTWTIQHLNIPEQREGRDPGWRGDLKWRLKGMWQTMKWMLVTVIAPEFILGKALGDREDAKNDLEEFQRYAKEDDVPWSMTHSLFANMGGFVIRFNVDRLANYVNETATQTTNPEEGAEIQRQEISQSSSNGTSSNPYIIKAPIKTAVAKRGVPKWQSRECYNNPFHLCASQILELRRTGLLRRLPYITIEEINDKSKSDSLVRAIAVVQILWTVVQIITRAARHLAVSQLEIAVIAFAVCAIITYALNWNKPKGVLVPHTLLQYRNEIPDQICAFLDKPRDIDQSWIDAMANLFARITEERLGCPISNSSHISGGGGANIAGLFVASIVFGGLHLAAWDLVLPTRIEKILWRVASLWCTSALPGTLFAGIILGEYLNLISFMIVGFFYSCNILYALARLFLMVEIFRSLCFLPPDAYTATWATNIPHIA
jgi:hypothetical protein